MATMVEGTKKKPTILVVDDEAGPRDALKVILRPFFNIQSAGSAKAALDVLTTQPIDLVTLDQRLPDRQGMDLLQDIKHDHANIEVIIVTGYGCLKSAIDGIRHGAAGYLLKPFNVSELISLINRTLEKKHRLDFLRNFFRSTPALWGSEQESASAWQALRSSYCALAPCSFQTTAPFSEKTGVLPLLSDILEATDRQLLNHSSRVSFYATLLGNRLKLTSQEQEALAMGALLHDIGKIGINYDTYADNQSALSDNDAACVEYSERGAHLIRSFGLPAEVAQIVAYHHTRWDGHHSQHGLRGEGIPLLARIVAIAETFDHLTAESHGTPPLSIDDAVRRLSLQAHTIFDSKLTDLFSDVVRECRASLPPMGIAA